MDPPELDYINPETGEDVLPTLGFTALRIAAETTVSPPLRSASAAFHVIEGRGQSRIGGETVDWGPKDTFTAPVFAAIDHTATEDAYLIRVHDRPLQTKLGYYEERPR
jgi:gentisate 1,2-dioxygenase